MADEAKYYGHKTMLDGTHQPLSEGDARALWAGVEAAQKQRAESMPTSADALRAALSAQERMRELGWRQGGGLRVKRGDECAVAELGSTGMWAGSVDDEGMYVHYAGCVTDPRKVWLKPIADLTDDERALMERCDADAKTMREADMRSYALFVEAADEAGPNIKEQSNG